MRIEDYPAPAQRFLLYPGATPGVSYLFDDGRLRPLDDDELAPLVENRTPVVCSGSNACPGQVRRKLEGVRGPQRVPFVRAELRDAAPVYAGHVASYGAIPATLDRVPGRWPAYVGYFTREQVAAVAATEGGNYELVRIDVAAALPGGLRARSPWAFLACAGVLELDGRAPIPLAERTQAELWRGILGGEAGAYLADPAGMRPRVLRRLRRRPARIPVRDRRESD